MSTVLTFTQAIILFTILQTVALALLLVKTSKTSAGRDFAVDVRAAKVLSLTSCLLAVATFTSTWLLPGYRESAPYYAMLFALTILILINTLAKGRESVPTSFFSIVFWHLSIYMDPIPSVDISLGEGNQMDRALAYNGRWDFKWAHNPTYNPFPTMAFLRVALSEMLGFPWYSFIPAFFLSLAWWIAYDLIIYTLTYLVTRDRTASFISMMFVAITPLTPLHQHPYQWSSNMMWIAALVVFFKRALQGAPPRASDLTAIVLLSAGAFLTHVTGLALPLMVALALLTWALTMKVKTRISRVVAIEEFALTTSKALLIVLILISVIFIIRVSYSAETFEYIFPILRGIITSPIHVFEKVFSPALQTMGGGHTPLFERAGVNPIQAYSWTLGVSAAMAWIVYRLLKERRLTFTELFLAVPTIVVVGYAFLAYGIFRVDSAYFMNRTSYVFIPLLYPLASLTMSKIAKQGKISLLLVILLIASAATIASHDPNISPIQFAAIRGSEHVPLSAGDIIKAQFIVEHLETYSIREIGIYSVELFKTGTYRRTGIGGVWTPVMTSKLEVALNLYIFIQNLDYIKKFIQITTLDNEENLLNYCVLFSDGKSHVVTRREA